MQDQAVERTAAVDGQTLWLLHSSQLEQEAKEDVLSGVLTLFKSTKPLLNSCLTTFLISYDTSHSNASWGIQRIEGNWSGGCM